MPRALWKGAIAFSLVHIPVTLYPAATASELDFKMLDRRDMAPVGYQRINKRSGEPVPGDEIVKGYEYEDDQYVVLSSEDFRDANVQATQTVDIFAFVHADEIPPYHFETPYYLEPSKRGAKGYALLREVLRRKQRIALANVVIRTRQHLAALVPVGRMLVLDTLRFADEIRAFDTSTLPGEDLAALKVSERELAMAERLVDDMEEAWRPAQYRDTYREDLLALIHRKVEAGETRVLTEPREGGGAAETGAEVVDLMALLKRSLEARGHHERATPSHTPPRKAAGHHGMRKRS
jgi:DNA end-binding protein Ku